MTSNRAIKQKAKKVKGQKEDQNKEKILCVSMTVTKGNER